MAKGFKTGGRQAGTPNKLTSELRSVLKDFIYSELEEIPTRLKELPNKERLEVVLKLLPYALPKIEPVKSNRDEPGGWNL